VVLVVVVRVQGLHRIVLVLQNVPKPALHLQPDRLLPVVVAVVV
jgi:hypothetical protein